MALPSCPVDSIVSRLNSSLNVSAVDRSINRIAHAVENHQIRFPIGEQFDDIQMARTTGEMQCCFSMLSAQTSMCSPPSASSAYLILFVHIDRGEIT